MKQDYPLSDPDWLAHRHDYLNYQYHFLLAPRAVRRDALFATDEYLPADLRSVTISEAEVRNAAPDQGALSYIFHSGFCCSTLMANALEIAGHCTSLKEPMLLNDLVGFGQHSGRRNELPAVLETALRLLAKPFDPNSLMLLKPSNVLNGFAQPMLNLRPASKALLMFAPLPVFLGSIARKGLWGRLWARELFLVLRSQNLTDLGFDDQQYFGQTDLQIAAICWLAHMKIFQDLIDRLGSARVRTLDSETTVEMPHQVLESALIFLGLDVPEDVRDDIVRKGAFRKHSKSGDAFSREERRIEQSKGDAPHADEIEKVSLWAHQIAERNAIPLRPQASLL